MQALEAFPAAGEIAAKKGARGRKTKKNQVRDVHMLVDNRKTGNSADYQSSPLLKTEVPTIFIFNFGVKINFQNSV